MNTLVVSLSHVGLSTKAHLQAQFATSRARIFERGGTSGALLFATLFLFFSATAYSQYKFDYVWLMGYPTEEPDPTYGVNIFDFASEQLEISSKQEGLALFFTNASISDNNGELLFYTNGCSVNNKNDVLMQNGEGLNPGDAYLSGNCPDYGNTIPDGIMILPMPISSSKYFIFHQSSVTSLQGHIGILYYTLVDIDANSGLGKVIEKNKIIISDTMFANLHAVRHSNNVDWWIITSKAHNNLFYKLLFTANGIENIYEQNFGIDFDPWWSSGGQTKFSPDGTKLARCYKKDQVMLYDFDRTTGELSNFKQLYADTTEGFWSGLAFSSNSRYLYVNTQLKVFQFDLEDPDIQASKILIDEYDGTIASGLPVHFFLMQLGPDCKIYMTSPSSTRYMHVINEPNKPGLACDFQQHGIALPAPNHSIPNFPNYRLGTGYPVCDSNIVYVSSTFVPPLPAAQGVRLWPNPASQELHVENRLASQQPTTLWLFNATGQAVKRWELSAGQRELTISLAGLSDGLYFWNLSSGDGKIGSGKLIVSY